MLIDALLALASNTMHLWRFFLIELSFLTQFRLEELNAQILGLDQRLDPL
jgi:hypothetical protein